MDSVESHTCTKGCFNIFRLHWQGLLILCPPIIFLPVMLMSEDMANRCMYLLLVMAVYWISEVIPLAVTSMLPALAFPLMGIMTTEEACRLYFRDTLVMFVTSIMVASAIEYSNLHIRLALRVLQIVGCSPRRLHMGLCSVTMFMSIWISNSACTAMMCPIIFAVLEQLSAQGLVKQFHDDDLELPKAERRPSKLGNCFYLSVSYAASIGGCGSLIGTPTNLTFKGIYDGRFPESADKMEFGTYIAYALPFVLACTFFMYLVLEIVFMGLFRPNSQEAREIKVGKEGEEIGKKVIDEKYAELGPITTHEISIAILFVMLIALYIFRKPGFITGWAELFESPSIKNSAPTIFILILIFALPANYKFLKFWDAESLEKTPVLLTWKFVISKVPWGLIFLVGGGSTLAEGSKVSGMATKLGKSLSVLEVLPPTVLLLVVVTTAIILTNFSANVAIANITVPVLAEMAVVMKIHPLYLIFPVGMACSMAFMLPVGTPPNALVQGYANIETKDMIIGGLLPSITTILSIWIMAETWGMVIYPNMSKYPDWADAEVNDTKSLLDKFWLEI